MEGGQKLFDGGGDGETPWAKVRNGAQASPVVELPGERRSRSARDPRSRSALSTARRHEQSELVPMVRYS
jgi:hypothetical protein